MEKKDFQLNVTMDWSDAAIVTLIVLPFTPLIMYVKNDLGMDIGAELSAFIGALLFPIAAFCIAKKRKLFKQRLEMSKRKFTLIGLISAICSALGIISAILLAVLAYNSDTKVASLDRAYFEKMARQAVEIEESTSMLASAKQIDWETLSPEERQRLMQSTQYTAEQEKDIETKYKAEVDAKVKKLTDEYYAKELADNQSAQEERASLRADQMRLLFLSAIGFILASAALDYLRRKIYDSPTPG